MDYYICDHCGIEFGCERGRPIICLTCGKEQTPPAFKITSAIEHAVPQKPIETAMKKTRPSRLRKK